jgi:hypothetical protein
MRAAASASSTHFPRPGPLWYVRLVSATTAYVLHARSSSSRDVYVRPRIYVVHVPVARVGRQIELVERIY